MNLRAQHQPDINWGVGIASTRSTPTVNFEGTNSAALFVPTGSPELGVSTK
jgi:hypothetical protein